MLLRTLATLARLAVSAGPGSATPPATLQDSLLVVERALWQAWKVKDTDFYRRTLLPDAVYVSGSGTSSRDATIGQVERFRCTVDSTTLDHPDSRRIGRDAAVLIVHSTVDYTCGGQPKRAAVWSSTVFVRSGKNWQIAFHQESSAPPPTTPNHPPG